MQINQKSKRKNDNRILIKLKLTLLGFIIGTWLATFYPMIWLAPPLFQITPFVYVGLSLLWIPLVWRVRRRTIVDKLIQLLAVGCILASVLMTITFNKNMSNHLRCGNLSNNTVYCITSNIWCPETRFLKLGIIFVAQENPFDNGKIICPLF